MRALVLRAPETLEVATVPDPCASPGHVVIRVDMCGVCGSDVRYFHGENPWAKQTLGREIPNPPNIILGHEFVGVVEAVHDDGDRAILGRRVAVNTFLTCGRCHLCRSGRENLCPETRHFGHGQGWGTLDYYPGGMAEYCAVPSSQCYLLPDHIPSDHATFLDPIIAALHASDTGGPGMLDTVAIAGAGPIGLLLAQITKAAGAAETFICDVSDDNVAIALELGVDHALNVTRREQSFEQMVMERTHGVGVDLAFNTVGTTESIVETLRMVRQGGTLVMMATREPELRIPSLLLSGERAIQTSANAHYSDFPRAIDLLARGLVRVGPMITHRFPLTRGLDAMAAACNRGGSGAIKVIVECQS